MPIQRIVGGALCSLTAQEWIGSRHSFLENPDELIQFGQEISYPETYPSSAGFTKGERDVYR
jgi:hypothetical protein